MALTPSYVTREADLTGQKILTLNDGADHEVQAVAVVDGDGSQIEPLTDAQLRASDVKVSLDGESVAVTGPLTDAELRASAVPVSGPLTDAQLRASDVPVTLAGETVAVSGPLTDTQLRATDVPVTLAGETVAVSGPLTDTQLRATDVPVTLAGETVAVSGPLTDTQLRATDVPVTLAGETVVLNEYGVNDVATAGAVTYVGKEKSDGTWLVVKVDESSGTVIRYASVINNALVADYATAWAARATTLVYGTYGAAL
jgi:hypothetical protein